MKTQIYIAKALNSFTTYQTGATNTHTHAHTPKESDQLVFIWISSPEDSRAEDQGSWLPGRERAAGVHSFPELRSPKDGLAQPNPVEVSRGDRPSSRSFGGGGGGGGRGPGLTTRTVEKSLPFFSDQPSALLFCCPPRRGRGGGGGGCLRPPRLSPPDGLVRRIPRCPVTGQFGRA